MREAQSQIEQQYAAGTIDRGAYLDFQRELINTEQRLDDLKEKQKEFGSVAKQVMQEAAGKVNEFGEKMSGAGQSLLPATAAVTGFAALSVKAMDDVDAGLDLVMQKTGATGEEAAALGDVFNEVATSIPGEFADAGAAVGEVNTRLGFTGDALRDASEAFLKYAKVTVHDGDKLIPPEKIRIGEIVTIKANGQSWQSVLTGYEKAQNTHKFVFGYVRVDLDKILRIERRARA